MIARAETLLQVHALGELDRFGAFELACLMPRILDSGAPVPDALRMRLTDLDLMRAILALTPFRTAAEVFGDAL